MSARREPFWGSWLIVLTGLCFVYSLVWTIDGSKSFWWIILMTGGHVSLFAQVGPSIYRDRIA